MGEIVAADLMRFTVGQGDLGAPGSFPAYRHFGIRPEPGGGLVSAEAEFDSAYGRIASRWRVSDGCFHLTVTVPPGTTATVTMPDGRVFDVGPGEHHETCPTS
ncbi:alpha-L-rhamnosidase C-terminal domain-containing protein [Streptomyces sp. HD]|uniref:alpha-L-rhamnosidase C-terminal domain-containing protein n=1 Tax=Streptomyces sp. HD TaxID=3020892 RepID=UPI00232C453E|nr:alpha-L-rhamnosidase C-terminal domain-containing protein [Streptomyces sp. HD]MDC0770807.1 alpha-L-rhamnosidase C-terminal domain-containing protein [Streptomyces sp. HD]